MYYYAKAVWELNRLYEEFPSLEVLYEEVIIQKGKNINLWYTQPSKEQLITYSNFLLEIIDTEVDNVKYIEDNTIKSLSALNVQKVLLQNKDSWMNGTLNIEEFVSDITVAATIAKPVNLGVNLYDDLENRTAIRENFAVTPGLIELNIPYFSSFLEEGGVPPGSLAFFLASSNGGKTSSLIQTAHDAAFRGHNVLYVTAELSEDMIKKKLDGCLTGIPIQEIKAKARQVYDKITNSQNYINTASRIRIIEVPMGHTKPSEIDGAIQRLIKSGFKPNLLIVDYADNLQPEHRTEQHRIGINSIYKDLRAMAQKHKLVVWTASQMNDGGTAASEQANGIITMRHVNDDRGKIHLADLCIAIARTQAEKETNLARLVILKNRLGSGDGTVVQIHTRFDISRLINHSKSIVNLDSLREDSPIEGLELEDLSAKKYIINEVQD